MREFLLAGTKLNRYWIIVIIFLVALIIVTGFVAWSRYRPSRPVEIILPTQESIHGNISIGGAVTNPGIYPFSGGDTIGSLIQSAGGVKANGRSDNLQLSIPAANITASPQKININSADPWLLEALPGIGTTKAKAIIDYRQKNGFFRSVDELTKVDGISPALLAQINPFVTVAD
jgi:competence protein ComEA